MHSTAHEQMFACGGANKRVGVFSSFSGDEICMLPTNAGVNAPAGSAGTTDASRAAAEAIRSNFAPHEILLQPLTSWLAQAQHGQQPAAAAAGGGSEPKEAETVLDAAVAAAISPADVAAALRVRWAAAAEPVVHELECM